MRAPGVTIDRMEFVCSILVCYLYRILLAFDRSKFQYCALCSGECGPNFISHDITIPLMTQFYINTFSGSLWSPRSLLVLVSVIPIFSDKYLVWFMR